MPLFSPLCFGNGQKPLIAFHGVGQNIYLFQEWVSHFPDYTIWAFPLIFSTEKNTILKNTPYLYIENFKYWLSKQTFQKFSILGYSLGAKPALEIFAGFSNQIEKMYLIAPEGIKENFWYDFATKTILGQFLMQKFIYHPEILQNCIRLARKISLLPHSTAQIALSQTHSKEKLLIVWQSWMLYRNFKLSDLCKNELAKNAEKCIIFLGKKDKLTQNEAIIKWIYIFAPSISIKYLDGSHSALLNSFVRYLNKNREVV
ncbi:MAG: hypothetical protein OHK0038_02360 [Flammeovirgaceae bacterium]